MVCVREYKFKLNAIIIIVIKKVYFKNKYVLKNKQKHNYKVLNVNTIRLNPCLI